MLCDFCGSRAAAKRTDGRAMCECGMPKRESVKRPSDRRVNIGELHRQVIFDCGEYCEDVIQDFLALHGRKVRNPKVSIASGAVLAEVAA